MFGNKSPLSSAICTQHADLHSLKSHPHLQQLSRRMLGEVEDNITVCELRAFSYL